MLLPKTQKLLKQIMINIDKNREGTIFKEY